MQVLEPCPEHRLVLTRCATFQDLADDAVDAIFAACRRRAYAAGERLIEQGAAGNGLFVLVAGRAHASLAGDHSGMNIATFAPGELIGEMALVTGEPRTANVFADTDVEVLALARDDFNRLAQEHPGLAVVLTHVVGERLGSAARDGMGDKLVAGYRIERCVGRGGMAMVYRARDEHDRVVALKMMSHRLVFEPGAVQRFHTEADLLLPLRHRHLAAIHERFEAYGTNFIVMQFCDGHSLEQSLEQHGPGGERAVRALLGQLAAAVSFLHRHGILHRDLKPSNVMVDASGHVHLTDFGLAKLGASPVAADGDADEELIVGTPHYMAPELLRGGPASCSSDVYAFGCLAYELLTGGSPFGARDLYGLIEEKREHRLPPRRAIGRGISCRLHRLLRTCLSPQPEQRLVDLDDVARWSPFR